MLKKNFFLKIKIFEDRSQKNVRNCGQKLPLLQIASFTEFLEKFSKEKIFKTSFFLPLKLIVKKKILNIVEYSFK